MKKILLMLLVSLISGCSFGVHLTRGQDYIHDYDHLTHVLTKPSK